MNSEASIAGTNFSDILKHIPSNEFERLWEKIVSRDSIAHATRPDLQEILGDRFDIFKQTNNRIADRMDIERIRIPFLQLAGARMSYYSFRHRYRPVDAVQGQFIFFPLQTHTDSNVLINTQFGSVDAFLRLILPAFTIFHKRTGIRLAIKEHPIDVFRKRYIRRNSDGVIWIDPATSVSQILRHANCRATLVLNSTSGLESLIQQKPVICLGNALYRYPELVEIPEMLTTDSLIASLEKITDRKVDGAAVRQFCSFLSDRTQIEGNIESTPSEGDVRRFMRSIQDRIQKKFL
jgi:capsule polysaccharide modification protein KpsS